MADTEHLPAIGNDADTKPMEAIPPPLVARNGFNGLTVFVGFVLLSFWGLQVSTSPSRLDLEGDNEPAGTNQNERVIGSVRRILLEKDSVTALAWDDKSERLAVGSANGQLELWSVRLGKKIWQFQHTEPAITVAFSTFVDRRELPGAIRDRDTHDLLYSVHGQRIDDGFISCQLVCWDLKSSRRLFRKRLKMSKVVSVAFDSLGCTLAATALNRIEIWHLDSLRWRWRQSQGLYPLAIAAGGEEGADVLVAGARGQAALVMRGVEVLITEKLYPTSMTAVALSANGRRAASGFASDGSSNKMAPVIYWKNWDQGEEARQILSGTPGEVLKLFFAGTNQLYAWWVTYGEGDEKQRTSRLTAWDLGEGRLSGHMKLPEDTKTCALSPDGKWVATGLVGGEVHIDPVVLQ